MKLPVLISSSPFVITTPTAVAPFKKFIIFAFRERERVCRILFIKKCIDMFVVIKAYLDDYFTRG